MKYILRNFLVGSVFITMMISTLVFFIPVPILRLPLFKKPYKKYTHIVSYCWGRACFFINNTKMTVKGLENLPKNEEIIYIANHQGYCDIPFLLANMPTTVGFIAKKELRWAPIFGIWMMMLHCIFIDRSNFRKSMRDIEAGIKDAKQGFPKVIFPEGTRSKSSTMGDFKPGSILLAAKNNLTIVPITIVNTYKLWEEHKQLRKADLFLTVHPYIETSKLSDAEKKELPEKLWKTIADALPSTK